MRMHPIGAAGAQREIIVGARSWQNRRPGNAGDAILLPGGCQAVPMNQARLADMVFNPDPKRLARLGGDPENSAGLADAEDGSGLAVDLDVTALDPQNGRRRIARLRVQPRCRANRKSSGEKATARKHETLPNRITP